MTTKKRPGPARLPDNAVTDAALRARRSRERKALARRGAVPVVAGGPARCPICELEIAMTPESVYFDDPCGASCWAVGVAPTSFTMQRALDLGHTQAELDAAEAAPVEAA